MSLRDMSLPPSDNAYYVISLRRDGWTVPEIAKQVNLTVRTVSEIIRDAVDANYAQLDELVREAFTISALRLEVMYKYTFMMYESFVTKEEASPGQDYKKFVELSKLLIAIEVRKSALMGLDNKGTKTPEGAKHTLDWLASGPEDREIMEEVRRRGYRVPDTFGGLLDGRKQVSDDHREARGEGPGASREEAAQTVAR